MTSFAVSSASPHAPLVPPSPAPMPPRILVTPRLTLRAPHEVDLEAIAAAIGDFEVSRWLGQVPHPYTLADARHWYENVEVAPGDVRWTIHDAVGLAGIVSISVRVREGRDGAESEGFELGYWLARDRWGRGIMSEAVRAVLHDHFARSDDALISGAQDGNHASLAVQEKMGFERTHDIELPSRARGGLVTVHRTRLRREAFLDRFPVAGSA